MAKTPEDRQRELTYEVGSLILAWSHTEWKLMMLLAMLLGTSLDHARIVWAGATNFRAKRELLSRLGEKYLIDPLLPEFRTLLAKVKHVSEKRNLVAHDRAYHLKGATFRFMNDQDETQPNTFGRYRDVQVGTVRVWCKEAEALGSEIDRFMGLGAAFVHALLEQQKRQRELDPDRPPEDDHSPVDP